jgi:hypothetical protein
MTLTIAPPPDYQHATRSSAIIVAAAAPAEFVEPIDGAEEPMDYTPVAHGQLGAPDFPDEAWAEDGNGPLGF